MSTLKEKSNKLWARYAYIYFIRKKIGEVVWKGQVKKIAASQFDLRISLN